MKKFVLTLFVFSISVSVFSQEITDEKLKTLDAYFEQALSDWNVPGMAVGIIKDGEIVFSKGYGTRNVDTNEPVDGNTLFAIASNTKSFTAASLAMMVDEGLLNWDDPVRNYLPWFELYAPFVSESFTIRDLLTHRSGLATFSGDLLWYGTNHSREEVVRRAKYLEPVYGFREHYGYNNIMYIAAGLVIEEVSGMSWDEFVKSRILDPLEMDRTISSIRMLDGVENASAPHNDFEDGLITIEWQNWDNVAPAGALISSVNDVSKWLIFQMNKGVTPNGDTLIQAARFNEMWAASTPQYVSSWSQKTMPSTHFKAYGLGWGIFDYLGRKIIGHGGGYDGFITNTTFIPEEDLGFIILTNKNTSLYYPLKYKILDVLFDAEEQEDWSQKFLEFMNEREQKSAEMEELDALARYKKSKPTLKQEDYLGTYHCEMYGDASVYMDGDQMRVQLLPADFFIGHLNHWQYNTWQVEFKKITALPKGKVNFVISAQGKVEEMQIDVPNPDFDFTELKFYKEMNN